jgi:peroxiredoxin family protein
MTPTPLGIILLSGTHERAHFALSMAAAAAALGRTVVVFASGAGCRALLADWSDLADVGRDAVVRRRGVAGLGELRHAAQETGVRFLACDAGLRAEAIDPAALHEGVEVAGIATLLDAVGAGQMISF